MRGYRSVLGLSFVAGLRFLKVGEILGNVDNNMHVKFKGKQPSPTISGYFPRNAPLSNHKT